MSGLNNWDVYTSEEEEPEEMKEKETKQETVEKEEEYTNQRENQYLERYLPLEKELLQIIRENNFNDEKIRQIINERVKYLKAKGSEYGWKEVKKDKKTLSFPETKPEFRFEAQKRDENGKYQQASYKKEKKPYYEKEHRYENYQHNYSERPYYGSKNYSDDHHYHQYQDYSYNKPYGKYRKPRQDHYAEQPKKRYHKTGGDIFQQVMEDEKRRKEEKEQSFEAKKEENEPTYEETLQSLENVNLSKESETTKISEEKSEQREKSFLRENKFDQEISINKQSFTIGPEEHEGNIQRENLFQQAPQQRPAQQFYPNYPEKQASAQPGMLNYPYMYPYPNMPPYVNPQNPRQSGPVFQPTMEQIAMWQYYQMMMQQYGNQFNPYFQQQENFYKR